MGSSREIAMYLVDLVYVCNTLPLLTDALTGGVTYVSASGELIQISEAEVSSGDRKSVV